MRQGPVFLRHMLFQPFKLEEGARAPWAGQLDGIVSLEPGPLMRVCLMISGKRNAVGYSGLKKSVWRQRLLVQLWQNAVLRQ